ncbi:MULTISPECIES: DUF1254 domain-containing protein [unclassified Vibrio]|uniref:DUF1254 domain-containing protein n=1 Tax=unclassified Vibrio TaxID=2614977 RepID=UPI00159CF95D|nr:MULTISPECIES: DUF1254 domain-containing protein [unclassified Vibrio]NVN83605.1 DUF1254 domain-containing protein [Vibrio sp. Scap16]QLE94251.1 DUF1254 domain-containing protein [Vibrio sp. Scap24]
MIGKKTLLSLLVASTALSSIVVHAQDQAITPVTTSNYVEAEVDISFANIFKTAGANEFRHDRNLIDLEQQPAVTMNLDTVYSFGIFYVPKGTVISMPESKDNRYQSAMILQSDHYIDQVFYGAGNHEIESQTEFAAIVIRTQIDASDPADINYVNTLQDQIKVSFPEGTEVKEYEPRHWDMNSVDSIRAEYQVKAAQLPNFNETSGAHGTLDPEKQKMGVSVALGLLPPQDAMYLYRDYSLSNDMCYSATYNEPGFNDLGFYSFTMYGSDKYLHHGASNLNDRTIQKNEDGTFTLYFGSKELCGDVTNRLDTPTNNWYLGMRVYRAKADVIDGSYKLPIPTAIDNKYTETNQ